MASEGWRATSTSHLQTIGSHYYNITDSESWPVAGLLVLLDGQGRPVRSELHLYEDLPSHVQEAAVRQSRLVLHERYHGPDSVPLRILHTTQMREAMQVRLASAPPATARPVRPLPWQGIVLAGAFVAVVLLAWGGISWLQSGDSGADPGSTLVGNGAGTVVADLDAQTDDSAADSAAPMSDNTGELATDDATSAPPAVAVGPGELPPSRHARPDIQIGRQVQILPGFSLTLRSDAGARAGEAVGFLSNEGRALVVGGPRLTQGEADTIVWWLVELDDGMRAWAAANTSQTTLLVPID